MEEQKPWWMLVGGRQRLGRALAESLAADHHLVLTSSQPWESERTWLEALSNQTRVKTLQWNADHPDLVSSMMADIDALVGSGVTLENVVILAGSFPEMPLGSWSLSDLEHLWRLNLTFPLLAAQALGPRIRPGGCLQFLLDTAIHRPLLARLPYSVAKTGLAAMIPGMARLLAPNVRVVGHAPGVVLSETSRDPAFLADRNLLKKLGNPEDLLRAIRYAAESPYLTGEILTLDGGRRWA